MLYVPYVARRVSSLKRSNTQMLLISSLFLLVVEELTMV